MEATMSAPPVERTARWLKLLADENRLKILHLLQLEQELNVRALCERLQQSQPAVSHHLAMLKDQGVLVCRRAGKNNFYSIAPLHSDSLLAHILRKLNEETDHSMDSAARESA